MTTPNEYMIRRLTTAGYGCIVLAFLSVILVGGWGAWRDIVEVRRVSLNAEVGRLRSHAQRTVGRVERYLAERPEERSVISLRDAGWLRDYWREVVPHERQRLYAALVDETGVVAMHSTPQRQGGKLERRWFERRVLEAGEDVVETRSPILASGQLAYDIRVPVEIDGVEVGEYHSGFDAAWLDAHVARKRRVVIRRWLLIGALLAIIVLAAGVSLNRLARRTATLQEAVAMARTQRLAELGRLAGALAHEIRNPLNAVRLNLHALRQTARNGAALTSEDVETLLSESNDEIGRLESLVRTILGYARPDRPRLVDLDLHAELKATADFLRPLMERDNIALQTHTNGQPVVVSLDRDRFRQILLNLINNAREAVGGDGQIDVTLSTKDDWAAIEVEDSGQGVPPDQREEIFEPFHTTKERGCGLGLALVKRFIEEVRGEVHCEGGNGRGARFVVRLPLVQPAPVKSQTVA